jgi:hypothetical protein
MKRILHYGLQRSGTNVLETYLKQNFKIELLNNNLERANTLHKHFRLYEDKQYIPEIQFANDLTFNSFAAYEESFKLENKVDAILIISKDPYSWYLSYLNWAKKCNWPMVNYHYIEEYNRFHEKWIAFGKEDSRISFIKYIDLIENPKQVLTQLKSKHQLSLKLFKQIFGINYSIRKVSESDTFTQSNLKFYTQKEYLNKLDYTEIKAINNLISPTILSELGYPLESIV